MSLRWKSFRKDAHESSMDDQILSRGLSLRQSAASAAAWPARRQIAVALRMHRRFGHEFVGRDMSPATAPTTESTQRASERGTGRARREAAVAFLREAAAGRAREAFARYATRGFRHHNV